MATTRYCPSCGLERREGERFCRNCGTALGTGATRLHESPAVSRPPPAADPAHAPAAPSTAPAGAPGTALPAPPTAPQPIVQAPAAARPSSRPLPFKPFALAGGALLVVATFLPWVSVGGVSTNALDVPLEALWNLNASDGPIKLGYATLILGILGAGLSLLPRTAWVRRLCGSIALALAAAFVLQLFRSVNQAGGSFGDLIDVVGFGVIAAAIGGIGLQLSR